MKKLIPLVLSLLLSCMICIPVTAANDQTGSAADWVRAYRQRGLSAAVEETQVYLPQTSPTGADLAGLRSLCYPTETTEIDGVLWTELSVEEPTRVLPLCADLYGLSSVGTYLHINYTSADGQLVAIVYQGNTLESYCIYDPVSDCALSVMQDEWTIYENFRHGSSGPDEEDSRYE